MRFLLTTALSAGVALSASVALAAPEGDSNIDPVESADPMNAEERDRLDPDVVEEEAETGVGTESELPAATDPQEQPMGQDPSLQPGTPIDQPEGEMQSDDPIYQPAQPRSEVDTTDDDADQVEIDRSTTIITDDQLYGVEEDRPPSRIGMSLTAGGGVFDYADEDVRDLTDTGGAYSARLHVGTRSPVGLEVAYIGTAQGINALGLENDAVLLSNGVEGAVRLNLGVEMWQPYVMAGAAWKRYDITNTDVNTSSVADQDDVLEVPVGAGLAFRYAALILDGRAAYRFATQEDFLAIDNDDGAGLDNWDVTLRAGFEF